MNLKRVAAVLSLAGGITAGFAGTSHAQTALSGGCELRLTEVRALDLQETPTDEIYLRVGDERTGTRTFTEGQTREATELGNSDQITEFIAPGGFVVVSVVEDDPVVDTTIGTFRVPCRTASVQKDVAGAGAFYRVSYVVTQLP
ncbi:MAG TPA: hypothetical protein VF821_32710 [Lentzea sp.]